MCVQLGGPNAIIKSYDSNEAGNIVKTLMVKVSESVSLLSEACIWDCQCAELQLQSWSPVV